MGDIPNSEPVAKRVSRLNIGYSYVHSRFAEPREVPTREEARETIDKHYESGAPFFTKGLIQDMWDQIRRDPAPGDKILTKDITGAVVEYEVETGRVRSHRQYDDNTEIAYVL